MTDQITVYFNEHPDHWFGYVPNHPIRRVFGYDVPWFSTTATEELADEAFALFNLSPEVLLDEVSRGIATRYRQAGNRSLSIGDVLRIGQIWLACSSGWERLDIPPTIHDDTAPNHTLPDHMTLNHTGPNRTEPDDTAPDGTWRGGAALGDGSQS